MPFNNRIKSIVKSKGCKISCHYLFLEFLCLGGWEQEIMYNTLPGVTSNEDSINLYSSSMFESRTGNRRVPEYGTLNYYTEQEEDMVRIIRIGFFVLLSISFFISSALYNSYQMHF